MWYPPIYGMITAPVMFALAKQMMEIPSVTGGEKEIGNFLFDLLKARGYRVERQIVLPNRFNVLAFAGKPTIVLCTHIDTVPPVLPVSEDESFLYGRGACDTKGIIASMIHAAQGLLESGTRNFGLLFVVGEERNSAGAFAAARVQFRKRWDTGAYFDFTEDAALEGMKTSAGGVWFALMPVEETARINLVYRYETSDMYTYESHGVSLQFLFGLGPHRPHRF